jgi:septal ring factor EnvC (AmiA/AmiB activator)
MRQLGWQGRGTRWLTEARFQLAPEGGRKRQWILLAVVAAVVMVIVAAPAGDLLGTAGALAEAKARETALSAEVERLETRLAVEAATRRELEQQSAALNTEVAELAAQVEFLRSRGNGSR